jgi:hypothetical protein
LMQTEMFSLSHYYRTTRRHFDTYHEVQLYGMDSM